MFAKMYRPIKLLLIVITVLILGLNNACQAPEKSPVPPPVKPAPAAVQEPSTPPAAGNSAAAPAPKTAPTLHINSVKVTSPSRPEVIVYPPSVNPSENTTVSARVWETLDFECAAQDQTDHKMTYNWSCSAGKLRGEGSKVIWTAPGAGGDYTVVINVTCDKGESDVLTFKVAVKCCGN
jgi:hypothetical protein